MDTKKFLAIKPQELAREQHDALLKAVIERLELLMKRLNNEDYVSIRSLLCDSPAGDCMGCDNEFISFRDLMPRGDDIGDVINLLEELKAIAKDASK